MTNSQNSPSLDGRVNFADEYGGTSPFRLLPEMSVLNEKGDMDVSEAYFKSCMQNGRLNAYDYSVLEYVYDYRLLNRRMLEMLTAKRPDSLRRCLAKLTNNGFLVRYRFSTKTAEAFNPFFYAASRGVNDYFQKVSAIKRQYLVPFPLQACRILSVNQFIVTMQEYSQNFLNESRDCEILRGEFTYSVPYCVVLPLVSGDHAVVPFSVRRDKEGLVNAVNQLKLMCSSKLLLPSPIPVFICEDITHARELWRAVNGDEKTKGLNPFYTFDTALLGGNMLDRLYTCAPDDDGYPVFFESRLQIRRTLSFEDVVYEE